MTSVVETAARPRPFDAPASRRLGEALNDAAWLADLRAGAAALLESAELPDPRRSRPWKYADLESLDLWSFRPSEGRGWPGTPPAPSRSGQGARRTIEVERSTPAVPPRMDGAWSIYRTPASWRIIGPRFG